MSVRDLYLAARAMRAERKPAREVRQRLVALAHDLGMAEVREIRKGEMFEIVSGAEGKIVFDGTDYYYYGAGASS